MPQAVMRPDKLAYSIKEAAAALGVSKGTIYNRIRDGSLKSYKWVGRTLIRTEDLQAALDAASGRLAERQDDR